MTELFLTFPKDPLRHPVVGISAPFLVVGKSCYPAGLRDISRRSRDDKNRIGYMGAPQCIATCVLSASIPTSGAGANSGKFYPEASDEPNLKLYCTYPLSFYRTNQPVSIFGWAQGTFPPLSNTPLGTFPHCRGGKHPKGPSFMSQAHI